VDEAIHGSGDDGGHFSFANLQQRPLDIDRSFSFLTSLPGVKILSLSDSCNGAPPLRERSGGPDARVGLLRVQPRHEGMGGGAHL
jgi:hypothetical protein